MRCMSVGRIYIELAKRKSSRRDMVRRVGRGAWDLCVAQRLGREDRAEGSVEVDMVVDVNGDIVYEV